MPDITMCLGGDCVQKDSCYRYRAVADKHWQSFFVNPPVVVAENKEQICAQFWPLAEGYDIVAVAVITKAVRATARREVKKKKKEAEA